MRIQLGTLAAQMGQGVNQMDMQALQPELEHLKHAGGPSAYDGDVGCNGGTRVQVFGGHRRIRQLKSPIAGAVQIESVRSKRGLTLQQFELTFLTVPFVGIRQEALRLVMLFQPLATASSAFSLMKAS